MEHKKLLELALETLEKERSASDAAIAEVQELQDGKKRVFYSKRGMLIPVVVKRRSKTMAERKALSRKMKQFWAAKKLQAKLAAAARTAPAKAKRRPKSAAGKKALSLKIKQVWVRKKAEAAKKPTKK